MSKGFWKWNARRIGKFSNRKYDRCGTVISRENNNKYDYINLENRKYLCGKCNKRKIT